MFAEVKNSSIHTFKILDWLIWSTITTALHSGPLIWLMMELNLKDIFFQCSNSLSGPAESTSFLSWSFRIRTWWSWKQRFQFPSLRHQFIQSTMKFLRKLCASTFQNMGFIHHGIHDVQSFSFGPTTQTLNMLWDYVGMTS